MTDTDEDASRQRDRSPPTEASGPRGRQSGLPDWAWLGMLTIAIGAGTLSVGFGAFAS